MSSSIRNLPLLFQILFWYLAVLLAMPGPRQSIGIGLQPLLLFAADGFAYLERFGAPDAIAQWWRGLAEWAGPPAIYLNNRGLIMPRAIFGEGSRIVAAAFVIAILAVIGLRVWARRRQDATGARFPVLWTSLALLIGLPAAGDARDRLAGQLRGAGAARLQFRRRHAGDPGIHRAADRAHDLHRRLHRRGRPRRRAGGAEGADRGGHGARPAAQDRRCA